MVKVTLRRGCLGGIVFLAGLMLLLSLCFTVVKMDVTKAMGGLADSSFAVGSFSENGFDLLGGQCRTVGWFDLIVANANISGFYTYGDYSWFGVFAQSINIIVLCFACFMIVGAVLWFCFGKKEEFIQVLVVLALIMGIVYCIEGIMMSSLLNGEWRKLLDVSSGSVKLVKDLFYTSSFVPLILIVLFEIAYWVFSEVLKRLQIAAQQSEYVPQAEYAASTAAENSAESMDVFKYLEKLKELYDAGILTEQEFNEEKARALKK